METQVAFAELLPRVQAIIAGDGERTAKLAAVCELLAAEVPHYQWVGFYLTDPERERELVLGPFVGEATEHVRIPFGRGICGQAAETRQTFVIQDVRTEGNYLSCSPAVQSEIVIPILKGEVVYGELDIDSHRRAPFTVEDRLFLEQVGTAVARLF